MPECRWYYELFRNHTIIGDADYFTALNDVEKYALDSKKDSVLVKGLSLSELESLRG